MEKVIKILNELKEKDFLAKNISIKETKFTLNFKATRNKIYYHKKCNELSDESIKFAIFHEIGHFRSGYNISSIFAYSTIIISLILTIIFFLIFKIQTDPFGYSFIFLIFFIILFNSFKFILRYDEYRSDEYAAKVFIEKMGIKKPSIIIKKSFKEIKKLKAKKSWIEFLLKWIYILLFAYHPHEEDRIKKIDYIEKELLMLK